MAAATEGLKRYHVGSFTYIVAEHSQASSQPPVRKRSRSVGGDSRWPSVSNQNADPSVLAPREADIIKIKNPHPWLKGLSSEMWAPVEDQAVDNFMDKLLFTHALNDGHLLHA